MTTVQELQQGNVLCGRFGGGCCLPAGAMLSCLRCVVTVALPSPCGPVPRARYRTGAGSACLTLLVAEGIPLALLTHGLRSALPFSIGCFFPLSASEALKQSPVWASSSKASAVR